MTSGIGVSDHELVEHLAEVVADLSVPTCIVSKRRVQVLETLVGAALSRNGGPPAVTADRLEDLVDWIGDQQGPVAIVTYLTLWRRDVSPLDLETLRDRSPDETRLVFVEPTRGLGASAMLQNIARAMFRRRLGFSFHRDIPANLRSAGWRPTTVKRVSVGVPSSVMTFVVGEARRY